MARIPQNFIDDLLNRLDIVEVVDHRVKLRKSGKNYSACCPFHEEKTPSFTVSPDKQFYYCFGCGATGNAIGFVMEYERQGFIDAVETLAKTAGLEVPREERSHQQLVQESKSKALYDILEKAGAWFRAQLKEHPHKHRAVKYLQDRGLSGQIARDFGLGYAPPGWDNLLLRLGQTEGDRNNLIESGLAIHKEEESRLYDRFRERIMFPIRDTRGRVIGFGGRVLTNEKPKYLNSPETPVFHKGRELYGLYEARQSNSSLENLIVVEGYMDVIALAQFGINNAVATLGTACGEDHLNLAFRYVSEIVFCFDGDAAGRTAAKRALLAALPTMEDGRQVKFLFLPEGQDPDSLVRQIGRDRFLAQLKNATPLEEFLFDVAAEGTDISKMEGRARFSKTAAPLLNKLPRGIFRELMFTNLARRTGLDASTLAELTQEKIAFELDESTKEIAQPHSDHLPPQNQTTSAHSDQKNRNPRFSVRVHAADNATTLLLENPKLVSELRVKLKRHENADSKTLRLYALIDYVEKRPSCTFSSILGYWVATFGNGGLRDLGQLTANSFVKECKSSHSDYHTIKEIEDAFRTLNDSHFKPLVKNELAQLTALGFKNLNEEQRNRWKELIQESALKKQAD